MIRGAVLGSPISHSLSPVLHTAAYEFLNIEGQYRAIDVPGGTLATFFADNHENFEYFSLTMPLKEEEQQDPRYVPGKTCPHCFDRVTTAESLIPIQL